MADRLAPEDEARFWANLAATDAFFMGKHPLHEASRRITKILEDMDTP
jgi:hypothetical protein